ncbi:MAG TPA: RodZ domain-containing protein [Cellvibrionaceae bacterium]
MSEVSSEVVESLKLRPGEGLKKLREAAGISVLDVAEATRITRSRIEALERDDYASAGQSPAHVVGYMRSYARFLSVSVEPWLAVLERKLRQETELEQKQIVQEPVLVDSHRHYRVLPWVAFLVAGVIVWLVGSDFYSGASPLGQKIQAPELVLLNEMAAKDALAKDIVAPDSTVTSQNAGSAQTTGAHASLTSQAADAKAADMPKNMPVLDPTSPANSVPTQVINVGTPGAGDALVVAASDDCWIEVQDRSGKQVFAQLLRTGDNLRLFGVAPFSIKLGNAPAVSLWVNSREIPVQPENSRRTLRLVAGP